VIPNTEVFRTIIFQILSSKTKVYVMTLQAFLLPTCMGGGVVGRSREILHRIYPLGSAGQSSSIVLMADGAKLVPPVYACRG
jgi:hypothetical protein